MGKDKDILAAGAVSKKALDRTTFRRKMLMRLFASPWTLVPALAGITDLLALWTFDLNSGPAMFAGVAAILAAVGVTATRFFVSKEDLGKKVVHELEAEAQAERERALDDLDRRLAADGDPRTEWSLRDLRALTKAFDSSRDWSAGVDSFTAMGINSRVEELFGSCVKSLEKTLQLWNTARTMATRDAQQPILQQRERIIADVGESIKQLGKILAGIQSVTAGSDSQASELARVREELDRGLEVARSVAERMKRLDEELGTREL